jgi:uncharacterized protein (DUF885 family)
MSRFVQLGIAALLAGAAPAVALAAPATAAASAEDQRLTKFLDDQFAEEVRMRPQLATRLGMKEGQDKLDDNTEAGELKMLEWRRVSVAKMKREFDRAKLSPEGQVNYDIWALELDRAELSHKYRQYRPPFYSFLYSAHQTLPDFMINTHTVGSAEDMRAYNARLRAIPAALDVAIERSAKSANAGIRAPRFQVERVIAGSRAIVSGAPFGDGPDSPLMADAKAKVAKLTAANKLSAADADALLADTRAALIAMKPAYDRIIAFEQAELPKAPSGKVGAVSLHRGAAYYASALKLATTTDLTPQQIHAIGLKEVARLEAEQDALARKAGLADRNAYYADRAKRFPAVPWTDALRQEYLSRANAAIADTRTRLPNYFGELPAYRVEVVREPSFSEVAGGAAHAAGPSPDGVRPGRVYVHLQGNTLDPAKVYDLMCHEGIPGHVMQGDIQVRQNAGPKFRKVTGYVAFGEGWGLYSELLCKEMGSYPDLAADFMRLDAELFRAARLVTDTGIHAMGWTEDQAVDYMTRTGRLPPEQARSEVRRYITLPGQATGYKIGMLKIVELRRKAEAALGPKFDLPGFHDLLIASGSQPLTILERRVDAWIAARKG